MKYLERTPDVEINSDLKVPVIKARARETTRDGQEDGERAVSSYEIPIMGITFRLARARRRRKERGISRARFRASHNDDRDRVASSPKIVSRSYREAADGRIAMREPLDDIFSVAERTEVQSAVFRAESRHGRSDSKQRDIDYWRTILLDSAECGS